MGKKKRNSQILVSSHVSLAGPLNLRRGKKKRWRRLPQLNGDLSEAAARGTRERALALSSRTCPCGSGGGEKGKHSSLSFFFPLLSMNIEMQPQGRKEGKNFVPLLTMASPISAKTKKGKRRIFLQFTPFTRACLVSQVGMKGGKGKKNLSHPSVAALARATRRKEKVPFGSSSIPRCREKREKKPLRQPPAVWQG